MWPQMVSNYDVRNMCVNGSLANMEEGTSNVLTSHAAEQAVNQS